MIALRKAHAYVLWKKFNENKGKATIVIMVPPLLYHLQIIDPCMRIFFLMGFQELFQLKPCKIDSQRVHEFVETLQENGACKIIGRDGGFEEVLITREIVTQALHLLERNHKVSAMKLTLEEKKSVFKLEAAASSEMVYANLIDERVKLPLQFY